MFQKDLIPQKAITYIGENHILLEMIVVSVLILFMAAVFLKLSHMKKEVRQICRQVKRYLDVVLSEETEEEESLEEVQPEEVDLQQIHTYQRKKESEPEQSNQRIQEERQNQSQRDAELLMEVIQDVF